MGLQVTQTNVYIVSVQEIQSSAIQAYWIWLYFKEKQQGIKTRLLFYLQPDIS